MSALATGAPGLSWADTGSENPELADFCDLEVVWAALPNIVTYRGRSLLSGDKVVIKFAAGRDESVILQLRHEYRMLNYLHSQGVANVSEALYWADYSNGSAIVLTFGGPTFREIYLSKPVAERGPVDYLALMVNLRSIASTLQTVHALDCRHNNLRTDVFVALPDDPGRVYITSWLFSSRLAQELPFSQAAVLNTSLSYVAPECTGRMNSRHVDLRADLYTLGVTFYELITGEVPFSETTFLGLMHSHLAHQVVPLADYAQLHVPPMINELIMKLLQKNPEERYQTATGLLVDVEQIIQALGEGNASATIQIGREDGVSRFAIASDFVARENEMQELISLFDQLQQTSSSQVGVVAGYSGIGKSRLIKEMLLSMSHSNLFFAESKYDQYKAFAPFTTFASLFASLIAQIFVEPASKVGVWRRRISAALGDEAQALCELCPDLLTLLTESYIKSLPPLVALGGLAAEERFKRGINNLLQVFAGKERPLILFIDDIQWAPLVDLQLLCGLRTHKNLMILVAYRNNEVDAAHVVNTVFMTQIKPDLTLTLAPLPLSGTRKLICSTLHRPVAADGNEPAVQPETEELVQVIHAKTRGNAFFIGQVLQNLYAKHLLEYDFHQAAWTWNLTAIQAIDASEDVVALVLKLVCNLSPECREILSVASCLGNSSFRLGILSIILDRSHSEVASCLFEAMSAGLVISKDENYKAAMAVSSDWKPVTSSESALGEVSYRFLHDRVQQACFALVAEDRRPELHARIGLSLFSAYSQDESMLYDICLQVNRATDLIPDEQRMQMARLNIRAAGIAFHNTANDSAFQLLTAAARFFPENPWSVEDNFAQDYYMRLEEVCTSLADYDASKKAAHMVLQHATDKVVIVMIHGRLMKAELNAGRTKESLWYGLEGLRHAGLDLRDHFADGADDLVAKTTAELWASIPSTPGDIAALRDMPSMTHPLLSAAVDMTMELLPSVFFLRPACVSLVTLTAVRLSQEAHGNSFASAYFYSFTSLLLFEASAPSCDFVKGCAYSTLATSVLEDLLKTAPNIVPSVPSTLVIAACSSAWVSDARFEPRKICVRAQAEALRCFNGEYLAYACGNENLFCLFSGSLLEELSISSVKHLEVVESYKRPVGTLYIRPVLQTIYNLRHSSNIDDILQLKGKISSPGDLQDMADHSLVLHMAKYYACAVLVHVLFAPDQRESGLQLAEMANKCAPGAQGLTTTTYLGLYSLIILIDAERTEPLTDKQHQQKDKLMGYMQLWSTECPSFMGQWLPFFEAETSKSFETLGITLERFDSAIEKATAQSNYLLVGLFNERCARFLYSLSSSFHRAARGFALEAAHAYRAWGCEFKSQQLVTTYDLHHFAPLTSPPSLGRQSSDDFASISTGPDASAESWLSKTTLHAFPYKQLGKSKNGQQVQKQQRHKETLDTVEEASAELDLESVLQNALVLSSSQQLDEAIPLMLDHLLQVSGAQYVALVLADKEEGQLQVVMSGTWQRFETHKDVGLDDDGQAFAPAQLIHLAANSRKAIINDANTLEIGWRKGMLPKSCMALPVILQDKVTAVVYLSNSEISNLFSARKVELLTIMATQAAISIEKTQLLQELEAANQKLSESKAAVEHHASDLESIVEERTKQLALQNAQLVVAKNEAEQATLMKGRFLSNMSHEIRTPFNAVIGFSTLLLETKLDAEQKDMAQSIIDSSSDLLVIINDVLDLGKVEEGKMTLSPIWFDFRAMMESALEMIAQNAAQKHIDIAYLEGSESFDISQLYADNTRMRQCILNLLSNAVKFCPEDKDGFVRVTSRVDHLGTTDDNGDQDVMVTIDVEDNGIGIAESDMPKLFGFFSQVDDSTTRQYGGTGLGLAISRKMCRLFKGDLTVKSKLGEGSTFTASFCAKINRTSHPSQVWSCRQLKDKVCLILEPSDLVQESTRQHLDAFGVKWFSQRSLDDVSNATKKADLCIIGDSFNQPETIRALRKRYVNVDRLYLVVMMPFGATLPAQPHAKDEEAIDAVLSTPVRRSRLFKCLEDLYPSKIETPTNTSRKVSLTRESSGSREDKPVLKILLVEDNLVNVKVATQLLKRLGHVPKVANDGLQAVQRCALEDFDLILMDLQMPVLSGIGATLQIRAAQSKLKAPFICAMTANAMAGDEQRCLEAGMDHYISKPVMLPKLRSVIELVEAKVTAADAAIAAANGGEEEEQGNADGGARCRDASPTRLSSLLGQLDVKDGPQGS